MVMFKRWKRPSWTKRPAAPEESPPTARTREAPAGGSAGVEPAAAGSAEADPPAGSTPRAPRLRVPAHERERLLAEFAASDLSADEFAKRCAVRPKTFAAWLRGERTKGKPDPRLAKRFTPEERRGAVEAFLKSGRKREDFARLWGCSASSLDKWVRRFESEGDRKSVV